MGHTSCWKLSWMFIDYYHPRVPLSKCTVRQIPYHPYRTYSTTGIHQRKSFFPSSAKQKQKQKLMFLKQPQNFLFLHTILSSQESIYQDIVLHSFPIHR